MATKKRWARTAPNRGSKRRMAAELLASGAYDSEDSALKAAGFKDVKREKRRFDAFLATLPAGTDLTPVARRKLRAIIKRGLPEAVIAAVRELLKRAADVTALAGAICVDVVEQGLRLERAFMPAKPHYATTASEAVALIEQFFAEGGASTADAEALDDRTLCERALARILADDRIRDTTTIAACREVLSQLVVSPATKAGDRVLALVPANGFGPLRPHTIFLRGAVTFEAILTALDEPRAA